MKLRAWTFGRIVAFLLLGSLTICMIIAFIAGLYSLIFGRSDMIFSTFLIIMIFTGFPILLSLQLIMPRYYGCMQSVKGYMSYRNLKKHKSRIIYRAHKIFG